MEHFGDWSGGKHEVNKLYYIKHEESLFQQVFQTPRSALKKQGAAEFFFFNQFEVFGYPDETLLSLSCLRYIPSQTDHSNHRKPRNTVQLYNNCQ